MKEIQTQSPLTKAMTYSFTPSHDSSHIQSHGLSMHIKSWNVHTFEAVKRACIPSHADTFAILEFEIILEEGCANVAILKKIVLFTQLLQLKSSTKPTNKKGLRTSLKNALLDLALNIDVK